MGRTAMERGQLAAVAMLAAGMRYFIAGLTSGAIKG